jgi:hypothetical protein
LSPELDLIEWAGQRWRSDIEHTASVAGEEGLTESCDEHIVGRIIQSQGMVYSKLRKLSDRPTVAMCVERKTLSVIFRKDT